KSMRIRYDGDLTPVRFPTFWKIVMRARRDGGQLGLPRTPQAPANFTRSKAGVPRCTSPDSPRNKPPGSITGLETHRQSKAVGPDRAGIEQVAATGQA